MFVSFGIFSATRCLFLGMGMLWPGDRTSTFWSFSRVHTSDRTISYEIGGLRSICQLFWCKHDPARAFEGFWSIATCWIAKSSTKGYSFTMPLEGKRFFSLYTASILPLFPGQELSITEGALEMATLLLPLFGWQFLDTSRPQWYRNDTSWGPHWFTSLLMRLKTPNVLWCP